MADRQMGWIGMMALAFLGLLLLSFRAQAQEGQVKAGDAAPEFSLPDADGKDRNLSEWRGHWLILYFYPKDNTPGCTAEAHGFRERYGALQALDARVVGVSVDNSASHRAFADKQDLPFPLLADVGGDVARRYGALMNLPFFKLAKRHTFLIDPLGRIAKVYRDVAPGSHGAEIEADLKRLGAGRKP